MDLAVGLLLLRFQDDHLPIAARPVFGTGTCFSDQVQPKTESHKTPIAVNSDHIQYYPTGSPPFAEAHCFKASSAEDPCPTTTASTAGTRRRA